MKILRYMVKYIILKNINNSFGTSLFILKNEVLETIFKLRISISTAKNIFTFQSTIHDKNHIPTISRHRGAILTDSDKMKSTIQHTKLVIASLSLKKLIYSNTKLHKVTNIKL
jgi:hypothetical protein